MLIGYCSILKYYDFKILDLHNILDYNKYITKKHQEKRQL